MKMIVIRDFPGSPGVKTSHFHCRGHRLDPWSGNQDSTCHAAWPKKKKLWFETKALHAILYQVTWAVSVSFDPRGHSLPGFSVRAILEAGILHWVTSAIIWLIDLLNGESWWSGRHLIPEEIPTQIWQEWKYIILPSEEKFAFLVLNSSLNYFYFQPHYNLPIITAFSSKLRVLGLFVNSLYPPPPGGHWLT